MSKLPPAFPSSPTRPPKYGLYINGPSFDGRTRTTTSISFYSHYAVKRWLEVITKHYGKPDTVPSEYGWPEWWFGDYTIASRDESITYEDIMSRKLTEDEQAWQVPDYILNLYAITRPLAKTTVTGRTREDPNTQYIRKQPSTPRPRSDGLTSIQDIAKRLNISPSKARRTLRQLKIPQPACGWAWPDKEAEEIYARLK